MWQERILSRFLLKVQTKRITLNVTKYLGKIKYLEGKVSNQKSEKNFLIKDLSLINIFAFHPICFC